MKIPQAGKRKQIELDISPGRIDGVTDRGDVALPEKLDFLNDSHTFEFKSPPRNVRIKFEAAQQPVAARMDRAAAKTVDR